MDAKRDQNNITIGMGVSSVDGITPLPLRVDPVTGYLLVTFVTAAGGSTAPVSSIRRDSNNVHCAAGADENGLVRNLLIDPVNGYLEVR